MKFIKLESRGGNYLVVAENVAWLRTAENGQTNVGIIGSQPLLVVGSIEDVAAKILGSVNGQDPEEVSVPAPAPAQAAPSFVAEEQKLESVAQASEPEPIPEPAAATPEPEHEPERITAQPSLSTEPATPAKSIDAGSEPETSPLRLQPKTTGTARPRPVVVGTTSLWERAVAPAPKGLKIKAGSQRMMGMLE
jgi:hypothetical protein